jgi:hypothetical protein
MDSHHLFIYLFIIIHYMFLVGYKFSHPKADHLRFTNYTCMLDLHCLRRVQAMTCKED